jgi:ABC-2 type transport system ATP-binding protein
MTCGRVVIINKGRVVAEDTPGNLTRRLRGSGTLRLEVRGDATAAESALRTVAGIIALRARGTGEGATVFDVESEPGRDLRAELAAAVVGRGLGLLGLEQAGMSLEEIFLQLTTTDNASGTAASAAAEEVSA